MQDFAFDAPYQALTPDPLQGIQEVLSVRHWTDRLFSFRITRPRSLRFRSGEFVMIGLPGPDGRPVMRAYSIASPSWDDTLEFYSIKVPGGPLTAHLQQIRPGDGVILRPRAVGSLVLDSLTAGTTLWMICSGTGIAPFASLLRDPETWDRFPSVVLAQTCRTRNELAFGAELVRTLPDDPLIGEVVAGRLFHYPTTTREASETEGRVSDHLRDGRMFRTLGLPQWSPGRDRVMICGSLDLNRDVAQICASAGLREGSNHAAAGFVVEKAFVE